MKNLTLIDLATILQLDESLKIKLFNDFEKGDENLKKILTDILWKNFHELKDRLAGIKYHQFLKEVAEGKRVLMTDLYDEALSAVWQDFDDIVSGKKKDIDQIEDVMMQIKNAIPPKS